MCSTSKCTIDIPIIVYLTFSFPRSICHTLGLPFRPSLSLGLGDGGSYSRHRSLYRKLGSGASAQSPTLLNTGGNAIRKIIYFVMYNQMSVVLGWNNGTDWCSLKLFWTVLQEIIYLYTYKRISILKNCLLFTVYNDCQPKISTD